MFTVIMQILATNSSRLCSTGAFGSNRKKRRKRLRRAKTFLICYEATEE